MSSGSVGIEAAEVVVLLAGFAYAAAADLKNREVSDRLWQLLGAVGLVLGVIALAPGGTVPLATWLVVSALTLEHVFPWDDWLGEKWGRSADAIELFAYVGGIVGIGVAVAQYGVGPSAVPFAVVAVLATVLLARGLFELGALFGGADAKALMIAGIVVPFFPNPLIPELAVSRPLLGFLPFSIDLLTNAALFSLAAPIALAIRNLRREEFTLGRGFTGYSLPVRDLPNRFVWIDDPAWPEGRHTDDAETTAEDEHRRRSAARELQERGVSRVWVTPQLPFLLLMALGALGALLAGNVLLDLLLGV